jgi:hypothetical protein
MTGPARTHFTNDDALAGIVMKANSHCSPFAALDGITL